MFKIQELSWGTVQLLEFFCSLYRTLSSVTKATKDRYGMGSDGAHL